MKLSDTEVADLIKSERPWNVARRALSTGAARISAMENLSPLDLRRAELLLVAEIGAALGVPLAPESEGLPALIQAATISGGGDPGGPEAPEVREPGASAP